MLRRKLTGALLGVVALAAISGVGASAASAAVFTLTTTACTGGTQINLCYETAGKEKFELTGKQTIEVASETVAIFKVPSLEIEIECKKVVQGTLGENIITQTSPLTEKGKITGTLIFKECKVLGALGKKCTIPVEKETLALSGELTTGTNLRLTPPGGTFIELPFSNNGTETCPATVRGNHKITGFQDITVLEAGVAAEVKLGESIAKSGLKFSEAAAELTGTLELKFTGLGDKVYVSTVA